MFSFRKIFSNTKENDWNYNTDKELKSFGSLFQKDVLTIETREWVEKTKKMEQEINRDDLIYKTGNKKKE